MSNNSITAAGAECVGRLLWSCPSLRVLDISWNAARQKGGIALGVSARLRYRCVESACLFVSLTLNHGCAALLQEALAHNRTLRSLNVSFNGINDEVLSLMVGAVG